MNKLYLLASVTLLLASISASGARAKTADSVTVITYIDSIPDQFVPNNEEKARALVKQMNADTQHDPGLISYIILRETDHPNHFTILEVWKDDAAFNAHELAAHTRKFRNDLQPLIGSPYNILITKIFEQRNLTERISMQKIRMAAAMVIPVIIGGVALADTSKTVIYEVSEINIRPTAMTEEELRILFHKLIASTKQEPGLIQINVTQDHRGGFLGLALRFATQFYP